ncbi:hypothetical protein [Facklamia miroungae]|uniref:Uncharacterized protein n=1 Tax=Facklamia miroungae TaxID=120956 RepID=A0A1G7UVI2_9LACT|nr:hypothetical protein [Facklamia miroungae]NKZ30141.1 hypothetical protein [Facklamia miroungae]SDG51605.1 hypothetical protein SAMN05421791_11228 [Facklamia miroungae]
MLKDLPRLYQIIYYLSSMSLSIILFTLKILYSNFDQYNLNHFHILLIVLAVLFVLGLLSRWLYTNLKKKYARKTYTQQNQYDEEDFTKDKITDINGQPVSFLISNVTTVYIIQSFTWPSVFAYIFIHLILFTMMVEGESLQPNPFFLLYGLNIYKTKNNDFLYDFNEPFEHNAILKLNDNKDCRSYLVGSIDLNAKKK